MLPTTLRVWIARARETFSRSRIATEQDDEMRFHLEMQVEHNIRAGMSPDEARRSAVIAFGGRERFREETRDARGFVLVDDFIRDAKFAARRLRRSPGYTIGALGALGIGVGAAVGIGAIVFGVLVRELPYENADRLVRVSFLTPGSGVAGDLHSEASYTHFGASARSFERWGAYYTNDGINLSDGDEAERVTAGMVSPGAFRLLGVKPIRGQLFADTDTSWNSGSSPVLISQDLWERRYGSDPAIIGRRIEINRGARTVVGVLPRSFDFPSREVKIWYPLSLALDRPSLNDRYYHVVALLKPGISLAAAEAELNTLIPSLPDRYPTITRDIVARSGARVSVQSLRAATVAPVRGQLVLLGVMVFVVLFIATTNVASLSLLRAEHASHEVAIAQSLGATRGAIVRRFIAEGLVLGTASIVVAVPIAATILSTKLGFGQREIPRLHEVSFDVGTAVAIVLTALVAGAAIGAAAFTRARGDLSRLGDRLRATRATSSAAWRGAQRLLVTTQIAIALTLLVAAGLLGHSFLNLKTSRLGFEPTSATMFEATLPFAGYTRYVDAAGFHHRVTDRLRALPGASDAAAAMQLPLTARGGPELALRLQAVGETRQSVAMANGNIVTPNYFRVMSIPIARGRTFAAGDLRAEAPGVILSESVARSLFGDADPIGRRVHRAPETGVRHREFQVIGVVGDITGERIESGASPTAYFPMLHDADGLPRDSSPLPYVPRGAQYVVRGELPPTPQALRTLVRELDKRIPVVGIRPLTALVDSATARVRLTLLLLSVAGGAALLLGVMGVYSVVSYAAAGRKREFGVRLALGATPSRVTSMVLREGAVVAAAGVAVGLMAAWGGTRLLESLLFEVTATNLAEFALATLVLAAVTLVAMLVPAKRASRTDPAVVLRGE